ncbi:UDP-N-acetylmuramoylalanine--D-glutamate ligase [Amphibacillus marinus]|uniref:UDP-N-acetylmuramoylalanine--D-glutamate ligase n=1 Tax=Amphibacillus marinus TaxID=872970 RepID=A0A1H8I615_9BACI|nr:UDP-N-acetylmuramoyl-L-alanine--D-glutamate ligase [Amphibacillus marinus]SEN63278.1 UDP-N-acetylmuramoylalanine--D-glutamate ligase [Amphibacillus marinus]
MNKLTNFPYQRVLVLGLAKSGTAAANVLQRNGVSVIVNDLKATSDQPDVQSLVAKGVRVVLGEHPLELLNEVELVIKNPGIPYSNMMINHAQQTGLPVWTEIECLTYLIKNPIIAITGSNGKTTTTTLTYNMLKESGKSTKVAGNIGSAAIEVAEKMAEEDHLVLELSSFQLMGTELFKPKIAVLLNLFEAHLDYHGGFEGYQQAKAQIFRQLTSDDFLVYNADDKRVSKLVEQSPAQLIPFSVSTSMQEGAWVDETTVYFKNERIISRSDIRLVGDHNLENILASIAATKLLNASNEGIKEVLTTFQGVRHRLQYVTEKQGRLFYNDSKATNILASSKAITAFNQPVILIAGGLDRGNSFDELIPFLTNVKGLFLYGETASKLAEVGEKASVPVINTGDQLDQMIKQAYQFSDEGDVILLSPACASWDQFSTFEDRGDMFIDVVHKL